MKSIRQSMIGLDQKHSKNFATIKHNLANGYTCIVLTFSYFFMELLPIASIATTMLLLDWVFGGLYMGFGWRLFTYYVLGNQDQMREPGREVCF